MIITRNNGRVMHLNDHRQNNDILRKFHNKNNLWSHPDSREYGSLIAFLTCITV